MKKKEILEATKKFVAKTGSLPSRVDLASLGFNHDVVRRAFVNLDGLYKEIKKEFDILDIRDLNNAKLNKSTRVYIITTAIAGAKVDTNFLASIDGFCKKHKGELLIIPAQDSKQKIALDSALLDRKFVVRDLKLNESCSILGIGVKSRAVDTTTGLNRVGRRNGTFILGGTKRRLKYVATTNNKLPHAIMSTGSLTLPNYGLGDLVRKNDYIADSDHTMGAVIVELDKDGHYHFRDITADKSGAFIDLGIKYSGNRTSKVDSTLVLGDWHSGLTCPITKQATLELSKKLSISKWVMHDVFDAYSISHHDIGKEALLAKKANKGLLGLERELDQYVKDLVELSKLRQLIIVKSNHDEHLERYLSEARYIKDPVNHQLGLKLADAMIDGHNPLEWYTKRKAGKLNVKWLRRDEDYIIGGVQLGAHGDKGPNGSKGSITALEASYGDIVYGHAHTPQILRGAYCVGTSTPLKPDYGLGAPSSWLNAHCLVYPNGQRQLVNMINGKFSCLLG